MNNIYKKNDIVQICGRKSHYYSYWLMILSYNKSTKKYHYRLFDTDNPADKDKIGVYTNYSELGDINLLTLDNDYKLIKLIDNL
jgi:hypothetical protein